MDEIDRRTNGLTVIASYRVDVRVTRNIKCLRGTEKEDGDDDGEDVNE